MCGIVAYIGEKEAFPFLINGLKRLEYRGYDSAGIALINGSLNVYKRKGKVQELENYIQSQDISGNIGLGHTRWATHGEPNNINAHPHLSGNGRLVLVHNGIIENYAVLKSALQKLGHEFKSDTDSEVLVHLIEEIMIEQNVDVAEAVRLALNRVVGAYAIVVIDQENPDVIVAARFSSPLVVGIGENEFFIGSDATPIVGHTDEVVYLNDAEIAVVHRDGHYEIRNLHNEIQMPVVQKLDMEIEALEKGGFDYFMLKEIFEQPFTVAESMRGRLNAHEGWVTLGGLENIADRIDEIERIVFVACGTSWHSALFGEYIIEDLARIPVEVEYASEFRYRNPIIGKKDLVVAISQSGETADTLAAVKLAKEKGALLYGIVNMVGSSIARLTDSGSYIHCGHEIGVASTKAFTGQLALITMLSLCLAKRKKTIKEKDFLALLNELDRIPEKIQQTLNRCSKQIEYIADEIKESNNVLYLGRGYNFPIALEGALKLKEISYIHAEGYPAAEMKHGPIALIDENMPVVIIATNQSAYEKIVSNIQEVKARKGIVISIVNESEKTISQISDYVIKIPGTSEPLSPLLSVIPLQLLSYQIAVMRGCNVDQPRNLAKSVTVE